MEKLKKISYGWLIAILFVSQLIIGLPHTANAETSATQTEEQSQIPVNLDLNGQKYPLNVPKNSTVLDVIQKVTKDHNLTLNVSGQGESAYIQTIGDRPNKSESDYYWMAYKNGWSLDKSVGVEPIKANDQINLELTNDFTKDMPYKLEIKGKKDAILNETTAYREKSAGPATAYDLLNWVTTEKNIPLDATYSDSFGSYFINNIGNQELQTTSTGGEFWSFLVNDQVAQDGVSQHTLNPNDRVTFKVDTWGTIGDSDDQSQDQDQTNENEAGNQSNNGSSKQVEKVDKTQIHKAIQSTKNYIQTNGINTTWEAIGIKQSGNKLPAHFSELIRQEVKDHHGEFRKITDIERLIIGASAAGLNATSIEGYPLVQKLFHASSNQMMRQGLNGAVFGLLALDSGHYNVPKSATWTRDRLIHAILNKQTKQGFWVLNDGDKSGQVDMTGLVLTALAPYQSQKDVAASIDYAVHYLASVQADDGGFKDSILGETSESTAQAIIGLSSVGVDPQGEPFTKAKGNPMTFLMGYQTKNGGFAHQKGQSADSIATEQGLEALAAFNKFLNKDQLSIYQFQVPSKVSVSTSSKNSSKSTKSTKPTKSTKLANSDERADDQRSSSPKTLGKHESTSPEQASKSDNKASQTQRELPNTATNTPNMFAIGFIIFITGLIFYWINRRRHVHEK
ncbi:DUF4430 domain-containing protein [Terrilactibacillus laevilacticus]|uniref:DUF4430 domain-containing protein n=1 Tax=Terrilactibacillus laevilacticus TaxID=1380157 RepID=UPI0015EF7491|nr:DUF4430 domain-containing protein [Terrilactibacillus laevilacticus]